MSFNGRIHKRVYDETNLSIRQREKDFHTLGETNPTSQSKRSDPILRFTSSNEAIEAKGRLESTLDSPKQVEKSSHSPGILG